ncbi:hypothetical protein COT44_02885 [Candidatus Shapirobacteria bacterium CG08_land_8_20_14_0_20_39_18]|uniref:Uncharacterized protein n=1 Tax=Candidatus Shapirobacteria bacterium CG08_land_8_20_14_0_20_39_18 TaxID=1974883 RepID=A0A2M6XCZ0_9BACT|nr:MAG: hypothetical protein COT44_02885 [Candidatus Shapirobacteria bacterium CG08_land_8_20_14_0_20_39_18]PIY65626.1 MAG: hypothetical protein COY91_01995 [Candidatus Shapirobacteria bacterium CG_4_10_14_0_8_um_filter_39_15]PJE68100.1 MAG: hypothetical protein COU94_03775 [Candidatus Shapirobacteria bacterium CG10_big_fil_rev_8_21_14_0_10_38_8]
MDMKSYLWDFDEKELRKTEKGRIFILERMLNYGPDGEKIKLSEVKRYWDQLHLNSLARRLMTLLIWKKYQLLPKNKNLFWTV